MHAFWSRAMTKYYPADRPSAEIVLVLFFRCDQQIDESVDEGRLTCDMSCHCPCSHMPMMGCPVLELAGGKSFVDAG
jgi:hypothetical protein